jgi:hypothetical protein
MSEIKKLKQFGQGKIGFWAFVFRYCLGFIASD